MGVHMCLLSRTLTLTEISQYKASLTCITPAERPGTMVEAWYMADDAATGDQRLPHKTEPLQAVSLDQLAKVGVLYCKIASGDWANDELLGTIKRERGYTYEDQITCSPE